MLNDYILIRDIGKGSFGTVYLCKNIKNNKEYAAKVESKNNLKQEYNIHNTLQKSNNQIPKIYDYIRTSCKCMIIMERLGDNLDDMYIKTPQSFTKNVIFHLARNIIKIIEHVHKSGYIHRDIKPNNILVKKNTKDINEQTIIYLTDFGLATDIANVKFRMGNKLTGTMRYASVNVHLGIEPDMRDDMISIGYMLVYLFNGKLPWQGLNIECQDRREEVIANIKMTTSDKTLCYGLPNAIYAYISICKNMSFKEIPDYKKLYDLFI